MKKDPMKPHFCEVIRYHLPYNQGPILRLEGSGFLEFSKIKTVEGG